MTYEILMQHILDAMENMRKHNGEPTTITLNREVYSMLTKYMQSNEKPTIFGMKVKVEDSLPCHALFVIQRERTKCDKCGFCNSLNAITYSCPESGLTEWFMRAQAVIMELCRDNENDEPPWAATHSLLEKGDTDEQL